MVKEKKESLRVEIKKKRSGLTEGERKKLSARIIEKLKGLPEFKSAKVVMLYYPVRGEVDLLPLLEELVANKTKRVLLPKITADGEMVAVEVSDLNILRRGKFGIPEPLGGRIYKPEKIDLVVVPAVAFDESCNRLGMGKGFYDRFLLRVKGKKVGVAYDFQLLPSGELPTEGHDQKVDIVVTPTKICRRGG